MRLRPAVVALAWVAGRGGGDEETATAPTTTSPTPGEESCTPGTHSLVLRNGQAAEMRVTPHGGGDYALVVALHGAGGTPASALEAFRGGWKLPGLVLIAPASKGQTWSILRSETDVDLESVNLALGKAYERCRIDRRRIGLGGFSDGATHALTLGLSNGDLFPAIMALSPGGVLAGERGHAYFVISDEDVTTIIEGIFDLRTELRLIRGLLEEDDGEEEPDADA